MKKIRFLFIASLTFVLGFLSCRKEQTIPVAIDASYTVLNNNHTVPVQVAFANNTTGADHFLWTFDGGSPSTSTKKDPGVVEFATAGVHKITLEAWNDDERQVKEFLVQLDSAVKVAFDTAVVQNAFAPVSVKLTNRTTGGTSFAWTFEGGNPATSDLKNPPDVVFATPGNHAITLKVRNGRDSFSLTKTVTVAPPLAADFSIVPSFDDEDYEAPLTALLQNSTVSGLTWQWSATGGSISNSAEKSPSVYFATAGTYQVTLTAANGKSTQTVTKTIVVKPNTNLRTHSNVQLGISAAQASVGSFYSTRLRRVIKTSENLDTLGKWIDVVYFGINQNFAYNKFVSPDSAQAYTFPVLPQAQAVRFINTLELCNCGASLTAVQFDAMTTDALLQNLSVNATATGWQSFNNALPARIVLFQTADGRKGAIKVKQYVAAGTNSYIIADIKVQKND